ncbi:beta-ketoacyl-ACP synthase II [Candidatus Nitrosacidococcus tergens]|uniref:3-oxoacyl-[acyl-carrier-protein] synthase 2 n=1 Tax=Candidatus Nitrosacidococcus tergens TaxID=553981 RepID=A0A7G1Q9H0_9GAMM|nr:beta-ketoacyl-ACP synthase II [Candidatus Nitrosacidococcus tergens]CAB1275928.1 3-oxoacyl-[acyl-carrier-protein] synthase II [Candidatus Nitrosacidococcus tergens]
MINRRVVVTGLGTICPVGLNIKESWSNILKGKSGIRPITDFDATRFPVHFGGTIEGFDVKNYIPSKDSKKMDLFIHYGIAAAKEAIDDSGLEINEENATRVGVALGSGIGGLHAIELSHEAYLNGGSRKISPFFVPSSIINMLAGNLSIIYGIKGPNLAIVTACSTGTHNIGEAMHIIKRGDAEVMITGGAEMSTSPMSLGGFASARALSTRNDDPEAASRPWDIDRDGFVLGDGAGVLVLEELNHAQNRGAKIYAELAGFGMSADAHHMTQPPENGEGAIRCMSSALKNAQINVESLDYINAHGTSTPVGDQIEALAIKTFVGNFAKKVAVSSTKSMTGHLLGAAGGIEAVFSILSIRDQVIPPTINIFNLDPKCKGLNYVIGTSQEKEVKVVLSNSFGFGGTNGSLVFKQFS